MATNRLVGQTLGATVAATLLAYGLGSGKAPAFVAAGFAVIAASVRWPASTPACASPSAMNSPRRSRCCAVTRHYLRALAASAAR